MIELAGIQGDELDALTRRLTAGGLELREVREVPEMAKLAQVLGLPMKSAEPLDLEIDQWRSEDGGGTHTDYYLRGTTREVIVDALAKARAAGWSLPAGTHIAHEQLDKGWRTYVVSDEVSLDGTAILFTALQAWMLTTYLQTFDLDDLMPRTSAARVEVVAAFAAATAFLAAIAAGHSQPRPRQRLRRADRRRLARHARPRDRIGAARGAARRRARRDRRRRGGGRVRAALARLRRR